MAGMNNLHEVDQYIAFETFPNVDAFGEKNVNLNSVDNSFCLID